MPREKGPADATPVTWDQVHGFRMARHHLDRPVPKSRLAQAVADACGIQAQVMAAAQLSLRVRVRGLTQDDVDRALWRERTLARLWCMRGTVHLVPSNEVAVFARGSSTRQLERVANWLTRTGGTMASVDRLLGAAGDAMDRPRTRAEIAAHVRDTLGVPIENRGSGGWGDPHEVPGFRVGRSVVTVPDLAFIASYRIQACFGPDDGQGTTFVRPDVWLRDLRDLSLEDAEDALLRRYLRAFGPATVYDFAAWSILAVSRAKSIWSRMEDGICRVMLDGKPAGILREDLPALRRVQRGPETVRLLPYFDTFLMGHRGRDHLVDARHYKRIYRTAGWVYPAVLLEGHVAGEWGYERAGKALRVRVRPYEPLGDGVRDRIDEEAEDVARFLGSAEARVSFAKAR